VVVQQPVLGQAPTDLRLKVKAQPCVAPSEEEEEEEEEGSSSGADSQYWYEF